MRTSSFLLFILIPVAVHSQTAPGNVTGNLRWWLKSNVGTYNTGTTAATAGQTVATWDDQSTVANDAINATAGTRPIYRTGIINGYAALEFDGTKFLDASSLPGIGATESFHIFTVFKLNSFQTNGGNDALGTFIIDRRDVTNNLATLKIINTDKYFYQRRQDDGSNLSGPISSTAVNTSSFVIVDYFRNWASAASSTEGIYLNGALEVSQAGPTGSITGPLLKIGRHCTDVNGGVNGYFAEIALYNTNINTTASVRERIQSYLAIKYGITLSASMNYRKANGTVIYPSAGANSGYVNDIAGIGRDDVSGLTQSSSRSQNANFVITASAPSSLDDGDFFVWGSNNGSLTTPNSADVDGTTIKRRLSRVWKIAETGEVGTLTLTFDLSAVPGAKVQADLRLLIDRNGNGFSDNDRTPLTGTLAGNIFTVTTGANNTLDNNDFITIGSTNTSTTPLPVELMDFKVTYEKPEVVASWQTASELNNDFFTLERAGEDLSFSNIAVVPGSGTSKVRQSYSAVDANPIGGKSYYRVKQTDYDGTSTYSAPRYIFIEGSSELTLYPNPSDGRRLTFRLGNTPFRLTQVEVFDQTARPIEQQVVAAGEFNEYTVELNSRLPSGLYFIRATYNGKHEFLKLAVN